MENNELVRRYPQLFHMATAGSWSSIEEFGLWTTEDIARTARLGQDAEESILLMRRPATIEIHHPILGLVAIRDQGPLNLHNLRLEDLSIEEWLSVLNNRVFFWLHPARLDSLLGAVRYRHREQDVIIVDTESLIRDYAPSIFLSPLNSGATIYPSAPIRGSQTFQPISSYDFEAWRRKRSSDSAAIAELAVVGGVPNLRDYVVRVERRAGQVVKEILYES